MASGENPFSAMVDVIREEVRRGAGPSWNMGEVISVSPLKVRYQGVLLNADQVAAAGQWAAQLKVGDSVPVLPDRDDGRFAIMQPADLTAFASAEHDHDEAYSAIGHDHDSDYLGLTAKAANSAKLDNNTLAQVIAAAVADAKLAAHPVGSIYQSTDSTSPATLFGGTWKAFGAGRVLVGLDANDADFDAVEETGGEKSHALSAEENAKHAHSIAAKSGASALGSWGTVAFPSNTGTTSSMNTENSGTGAAHNNLQPYIVVYRWKRTA